MPVFLLFYKCIYLFYFSPPISSTMIYISNILYPDYCKINDSSPIPKIDKNEKYVLIFTSGKNTLKIFEELRDENVEFYFLVKNINYFIYKSYEYIRGES